MKLVTAHIEKQLYKTVLQSAINTIISDEPTTVGGQDLGFAPTQLLGA
tara:strand:- start:114 stop:257 length:144 start_codon:yes stop_codon:yes gene_type:complete